MPQLKFSYNLKTLRFERTGFPWRRILTNGIGLLVTGALFFGGILYLQNRIVESPLEKALRAENEALSRHKTLVQEQLTLKNMQMASLNTADRSLRKRILLTDEPIVEKNQTYSKEILAGDFNDFYGLMDELNVKTKASISRAGLQDYFFAKLYWPGKKDVEELRFFPTLSPVSNFKADQLACGFGNQINPFNKLLYEHNGIDIAAERGTDILAAGSGTIEIATMSEMPTGLGNYISINHGNGFVTRYAHLQSLKVYAGQKVKAGDVIATLGMSGGVVAPHLHYEILRNGKYYNPTLFMIEETSVENFMALAEIGNTTKQALD